MELTWTLGLPITCGWEYWAIPPVHPRRKHILGLALSETCHPPAKPLRSPRSLASQQSKSNISPTASGAHRELAYQASRPGRTRLVRLFTCFFFINFFVFSFILIFQTIINRNISKHKINKIVNMKNDNAM